MPFLHALLWSLTAQSNPCVPLASVESVTDLRSVVVSQDGGLPQWEDGGLLPADLDIVLPTDGNTGASLQAFGWMYRYNHGLFQFDFSLGKLIAALSLEWRGENDSGERSRNHLEASADVAEAMVRYGRPDEHIELGVNAGVGFNWGNTISDVDGNGIPEIHMTRRLPFSPVHVGIHFEDVEQVMTRERYKEIERQAAQMANEKYGHFWPSQAKADYYQGAKKSLLEQEVQTNGSP